MSYFIYPFFVVSDTFSVYPVLYLLAGDTDLSKKPDGKCASA